MCQKNTFKRHVDLFRAYSRPLLGVTITPNLVLSLKMVKNDICIGGASK